MRVWSQVHRAVAASLVLAALVVAPLAVAAAPVRAQDGGAGASSGDTALASLADCVRDRNHLVALLVIDESGSLRETDPEHRRVTAATSAVRDLARLAGIALDGVAPTVEVRVTGFSTRLAADQPWTRLDAATLSAVESALASFTARNRGIDTDYAEAFLAARQLLAERVAQLTAAGGQPPCRALLVFTDGAYSLEPRTTPARREAGLVTSYAPDVLLDTEAGVAAAIARGREILCTAGGVRDGLTQDGVTTIGVALTTGIAPEDEAFFRGLVERAGCGTDVGVDDGVALTTGELGGLLTAFDRVTNTIAGGTLALEGVDLPICSPSLCPEGSRTFSLDAGVRRVHVLADLGTADVGLALQPPSGEPVLLPAGASTDTVATDAEVVAAPLGATALSADLVLPPSSTSWHGTWTVGLVGPAAVPEAHGRVQVFLFGGLRPELVERPDLRVGERGEAVLALVDEGGTAIRAVPDGADLDVALTSSDGEALGELAAAHPDDAGRIRVPIAIDDAFGGTLVVLRAELSTATADGVAFAPVTRTWQLQVAPPAGFPTVAPAELALPSLTGAGDVRGALELDGGKDGGCVWLSGVDVASAPDGVALRSTAPDATSAASCVDLAPGERTVLEVVLGADVSATGRAEGALDLVLRSGATGDERRVTLPWSFAMARPVDQGRRLGLFLALLAVGLAMPLLLLWALNRATARFGAPGFLRSAVLDVEMVGETLRHATGDRAGAAFALRADDFRAVEVQETKPRRFTWLGYDLRTRTPAPWATPVGLIAARDGRAVTASRGKVSGRRAVSVGKLPLDLVDTWAFALDPAYTPEEPVRGQLLVLRSMRAFRSGEERVEELVRADLPVAAAALAAAELRRRPPRSDRPEDPTDGDAVVVQPAGPLADDWATSALVAPVGPAAAPSWVIASPTGAPVDGGVSIAPLDAWGPATPSWEPVPPTPLREPTSLTPRTSNAPAVVGAAPVTGGPLGADVAPIGTWGHAPTAQPGPLGWSDDSATATPGPSSLTKPGRARRGRRHRDAAPKGWSVPADAPDLPDLRGPLSGPLDPTAPRT